MQSYRLIDFHVDKKLLLENIDPPTILNNFIYVFGLYDIAQGFGYARVCYESEGLLGFLLQNNSKYNYEKGYSKTITDDFFDLTFYAYFDFLEYHGVDLKSVFADFYNNQIQDNYKIEGFLFNPSPSQNSYYE